MNRCDECGKNYKYKRNLKRHIMERHTVVKHWKCTVEDCTSKFIRRGYLFEHLIKCHKLTRSDARKATLFARREDSSHTQSYYEEVSSDDEIFDILAEQSEMDLAESIDILNNFDIEKLDYADGACSENIHNVNPANATVNVGSCNDNVVSEEVIHDVSGSPENVNVNPDSESVVYNEDVQDSNVNNDVNVNLYLGINVCQQNVSEVNIGVCDEDVNDVQRSSDVEENVSEYCDASVGQVDNYSDISDAEDSVNSVVTSDISCIDSNDKSDISVIEIDDSVSDVENEIQRRTLRTEVEVWSRAAFRYTTYRGEEAIFSTLSYEDDFHCYTLKN